MPSRRLYSVWTWRWVNITPRGPPGDRVLGVLYNSAAGFWKPEKVLAGQSALEARATRRACQVTMKTGLLE
jgi:hypothetical protein